MKVIRDTVDTKQLPGYKRLLTEEYWKIPDDQFNGVIDETLDYVKNGRIEIIQIVKEEIIDCMVAIWSNIFDHISNKLDITNKVDIIIDNVAPRSPRSP